MKFRNLTSYIDLKLAERSGGAIFCIKDLLKGLLCKYGPLKDPLCKKDLLCRNPRKEEAEEEDGINIFQMQTLLLLDFAGKDMEPRWK